MKHTNIILIVLLAFTLSGCGIIPKDVEYFQDKVEKMPSVSSKHKEKQKQAAEYLYTKTDETLMAALVENASTNVVKPAVDANVVAKSLTGSLGKPQSPWRKEAERLAEELDKKDAELDAALEKFRNLNDENAGKKIEGTGTFQLGYFTNFAVIGALILVAWIGLKVVGSLNAPVAIGTKLIGGGVSATAKLMKKGFGEMLEGGQEFKKKIETEIVDPAQRELVKKLFRESQQGKQSRDIQELIKQVKS